MTCPRVFHGTGVVVRGRAAPFLVTGRVPGTGVTGPLPACGARIGCAVPACGAGVTTLGAAAAAWETGGIAPRPCACTPAGRKTTIPARMSWRTIIPTSRPGLPSLSPTTFPRYSLRRMRAMQHRFQSNSFASASSKRPLISPSSANNPFLSPTRYSPSPIPFHCAITVEPWNAPRNGSQPRSRSSRHKPQLNPLRLCRLTRVPSLVPKILRGIVPSARSGWSRGAAS